MFKKNTHFFAFVMSDGLPEKRRSGRKLSYPLVFFTAHARQEPHPFLALRVMFHWLSRFVEVLGWFQNERSKTFETFARRQESKFCWFYVPAMSYATTTETLRLQRITVEQLRTELKVNRIKVSEAANELKTYVEKIQREDPLVTGVPGNQNPFKEKSSCTLI